MNRWGLIVGMICTLCPFFLLGQAPSEPLGPITKETWDMDLQVFAGDAPAVVLLDYGWASYSPVNNAFLTQYQYIKRIRIRSEEGLPYAKVSISFNTKEKRLAQISAATYSLNPEGEVIRFKVPKRAFKRIGDRTGIQTVTFTLPLVKVGSIIEYSYTFENRRQNNVEYWRFADTLPVLHSEFQAFIPYALNVKRFTKGDMSKVKVSSAPYTQNGGPSPGLSAIDRFNTYARESRQAAFRFGEIESFAMDSIPPLEPEPFALDPDAYVTSVGFEFVQDRNNVRQSGTFDKWGDLNKFILKRQKPRKLKTPEGLIDKEYRGSASLSREGQIEKIEEIYRRCKSYLTWNKEFSWRAKRLDKVWQSREGNSAELNLLLCFALREAGFDSHMVLVRTADKGPVVPNYPNLQQFNHQIVAIDMVEQFLLLDLINETDAFNLLPPHDLNQLGLKTDPENPMWVSLRFQNPDIRYTYSRFTLSDGGRLTGEISIVNQKHSARQARQRINKLEGDLEAYFRKYQLIGMGDARFLESEINNLDQPSEPLKAEASLTSKAFVEKAEDVIIIKPMMIKQLKENPFPIQDRSTPIDLLRPLRDSHLIGLRLPEGYTVAQLPQPIKVSLPNGAGTFIYNVMQNDNILHLSSSIFLNQTVFMPQEYGNLRKFFEYIVSKHDEDIVIVREEEKP